MDVLPVKEGMLHLPIEKRLHGLGKVGNGIIQSSSTPSLTSQTVAFEICVLTKALPQCFCRPSWRQAALPLICDNFLQNTF